MLIHSLNIWATLLNAKSWNKFKIFPSRYEVYVIIYFDIGKGISYKMSFFLVLYTWRQKKWKILLKRKTDDNVENDFLCPLFVSLFCLFFSFNFWTKNMYSACKQKLYSQLIYCTVQFSNGTWVCVKWNSLDRTIHLNLIKFLKYFFTIHIPTLVFFLAFGLTFSCCSSWFIKYSWRYTISWCYVR